MTHSFPHRRSSDLAGAMRTPACRQVQPIRSCVVAEVDAVATLAILLEHAPCERLQVDFVGAVVDARFACMAIHQPERRVVGRSEEHTSELQSLMRISYAVFCLKKHITIETY